MLKKKLKKAISVFQWLLTTVLVLVVLLLIFTAFNPVKSFQIFRVMSGSMEPKIKVGSVVFVQKVKPETLKEGNIITFTSREDPNISITHRLIATEEKEGQTVFKTRGDANNSDDISETLPGQIKGKVVFSLPFLGYLSVWIRKPLGFGLLVILPALLIIISEILNIKKAIEKEVEKKYADAKDAKKKFRSLSLLIFFLLGISFFQIKPTNAYFSDVVVVGSNTFSMASDWTPPSASLSITGSFTKSVTEKVSNGDFESGLDGWTTAGKVDLINGSETITDASPSPTIAVSPVDGTKMVRVGHTEGDSGNNVWENRLMGSFDSGAKSLSLNYNFFSRDYTPFDDPGFFVRLNGQEIFKLNTLSVNPDDEIDGLAYNTGWSEFYYDLSNHIDSKVNLSIYGGNTGYGDKDVQSWVYIDKITTYFVSAPSYAVYTLSGDDNSSGSGINHYEYDIDNAGWIAGNTFGNTPPLSNGGEHTVLYRSVDNAGNYSPIYTVRIITDDKEPGAITDLLIDSDLTTSNSVTLSWNAPYNDFDNPASGKAASYDVRYSTAPIDENNFASAEKVDQIPSPKEYNTLDPLVDEFFDLYQEHLEVTGLNPSTTYYFAIKAADEAPNWTGLSNVVNGTTASGLAVNSGDIVINELMWMGSSVSYADEWLELRNMTDRTIVLSGFSLTKFDGTSEVPIVISFADKSIAPHGYFLIANDNSYSGGDSQLKDTIAPDIWDSSLDLSDDTLQINLYWNDGATDYLIDTAWDGSTPTEGVYNNTPGSKKYYSMERTFVPEDGSDPLNWYTCIDGASTSDFFDNSADERGTPGAANRSENEPLANQPSTPRVIPTPSPTVSPEPSFSPEPTLTPSPSSEPSPTASPEQSPSPSPQPTSTPSPTPEASPTPTPTAEPSPSPSPTPTPTLTPTPSPTSEV